MPICVGAPPLKKCLEHQLCASLEQLRERGYWASPFPEGDGITFSHESYDEDTAAKDIQSCCQWLEIELPGENFQESLKQLHVGRKVRVRYLVPVDKLLQWQDLIELGPYKIHRPVIPGERTVHNHPWGMDLLDIAGAEIDDEWDPATAPQGSLARLLDFPLVEGETQVDASLFFPVGAGTTEHEPLVLQITDHADRAIDVLRHNYCHYKIPHYTPNQAGVLAHWEFRVAYLMPDAPDLDNGLVIAKGQVFEGMK